MNTLLKLIIDNSHQLDHIGSQAGAGGEYMSNLICRLSHNHQTPELSNRWNDVNRWVYKDIVLDNLFLKFGIWAQNNTTVDEFDSWIVNHYTNVEIKKLTSNLRLHLNANNRILFRTHGLPENISNIFKGVNLNIWGGGAKWSVYSKQLTSIKIFAYTYSDLDIHNIKRHYNILKQIQTNIIDESIFDDRIAQLSNVDINAHSVIGLMNPSKLFKKDDDKLYTSEFMLNSILNVDPIIFNERKYFWNNTPKGIESRELCKLTADKYLAPDYDFITVGESLFDSTVPDLFGIDPVLFKDSMMEWHNNNMDLIEETEIEIGYRLLNIDYDYSTK